MSKRMKIIFTLSLVLNALLAGLFMGHMTASHRYRPATEMQEVRSDMRKDITNERAKLATIMKSENFDQAQFDAQLQKLSDVQCNFNREYMIKFNEKMQKLPIEKRTEIIDKTMSRDGKGKSKGKARRK